MQQIKIYLLLFVTMACTFARAQETPKSTDATQSKASVYIYRYKQFVGAALAPSVYCDDVQLARMDNGRYFLATLDPGKHTFRSNDAQSGILLEMQPGEQYFIRVEIATGFMKGHGRLVLMSREQASYELVSTKLKPLDGDKVADKQRVSVEEAHPQAPTQAAKAPAPAVAAPMAAPPTAGDHPVTGVTISDGGSNPSSMSGEPTSLGEAARRAREKKQQPQQ
jgi:hypothetical protein